MPTVDNVDTVVVGAGAAGCVVARRLADAGMTVELIEAGAALGAVPPVELATVDAVAALGNAGRFWPRVSTVDSRGVLRRYLRGRGVGGTSAVNTLVLTPGDRADYERWDTEFGCEGWGWASIEPHLDAAVAALGPSVAEPGPLGSLFAEAALASGHRGEGVSADPDGLGVLAASLAAAGLHRRSVADRYLPGPPSTLTISPEATVTRLVAAGSRVIGVELADGTVRSAGHVVVCAGALHTPALLHASAMTPPAIGVAVEDHPSFVFTVALRPHARQSPAEPSAPITTILRWSSAGLASSGRGRSSTDLMALVMDHVGIGEEGRRYGAVIVMLTDVESRGSLLRLEGTDVDFDPGWLRAPNDRTRMRTGVRHIAQLLATGPLTSIAEAVSIDDRGTPLATLMAMGDDQLDSWLLANPGPVSHVAGTARIGPGSDAPVDLQGAVRGWSNLSVMDASVLPHLPNANPQLVVMAVADRLASGLLV